MYYLCDCCNKPIDKGAYQITVETTEFCVCGLCNFYYNNLLNKKNEELAKTGNFWASFLLEYDMIKSNKKNAFAQMYCKINNKKTSNLNSK